MAAKSKSGRVDKQVKAFLASHLAHAPMYQASLRELSDVYRALGLPNADFVAEFISGKKPSLAQRGWEMLLARHLHAQDHRLSCPGRGPDFRFEHNGLVVWVEAIAPEARGLPTQIMNAMAASYDAVVRYVNRGRATALGLRPTTSPLPTRIMRDGTEPRAFVRSEPEAKPEAFILATQNAVGPAPAFARYEGCLILDRRLFSARGATHARPCGRPPMRVRDCAKSCALWD